MTLIRPRNVTRAILAVTFTNKPALEMKERVRKLAGNAAQRLVAMVCGPLPEVLAGRCRRWRQG